MKTKKITNNIHELIKEEKMLVPGKIFANKKLLKKIEEDKTLQQVANVAKLPGIINASIVMPDAHQGYGFPIGGVAAFDKEKGIISPGGVGYDINCGVRLLKTNLTTKDLEGKKEQLLNELYEAVPTGIGCKGTLTINKKELDNILQQGSKWMLQQGYATKKDLEHTEEKGNITPANTRNVSQRAKMRGIKQIGTLGAGNHFLDILQVEELYDKKAAEIYELKKEQIVILIHCGSRGLGHQVASDYIKLMDEEYGHPEYDRELVHAPINSHLGKNYLNAMACAANFAFANRQLITHNIRKVLTKIFPESKAELVYDLCHNIAKFEEHNINGEQKEVLIMRKGATRSFGPQRKEIPTTYKGIGQPVIIPGSMGTPSYILKGTTKAETLSFGSTAHGAGRNKSRTQAKKDKTYEQAKKDMEKKGILVKSKSHKGMIEEAPESYKNIEEVIQISHETGIGKKVAKLQPLLVIIG